MSSKVGMPSGRVSPFPIRDMDAAHRRCPVALAIFGALEQRREVGIELPGIVIPVNAVNPDSAVFARLAAGFQQPLLVQVMVQ